MKKPGVAVAVIVLGIVLFLAVREGSRLAQTEDEISPAVADSLGPDRERMPFESVVARSAEATGAASALAAVLSSVQSSSATTAFEALLDKTLEGDPVAGCRLLIAARQCEVFRQRAQREPQLVDRMAAQGVNEFWIEGIASVQEQAKFCEGWPGAEQVSADARVRARLLGLPIRARVIIAMTLADGRIMRLRSDQPENAVGRAGSGEEILPQFTADFGEQFLREGIQQADALALEGMIILHAPALSLQSNFNGRFFARPDPWQFAAYVRTWEGLFGPDSLHGTGVPELLQRVEAEMSPAQLRTLHQQVEVEVRRWRQLRGPDLRPMPPGLREDPSSVCAH
jgi:hypothetical protein